MVKAVSLFSGAGGFCEGVRLAGWKVLCSVEADDHACLTYAANFPDVPLFRGEIEDFLAKKSADVSEFAQLVDAGVDAVYGGPPCQGFSQIGPRNVDDPRNALYKQFVRVVRLLRPRVFVMENVPNMVTMKGGHFRDEVRQAFRAAGYSHITIRSVLASDFGVPQHRKRIFWFGVRDDLCGVADLDASVQEWLNDQRVPQVTVKQAISDLPRHVALDDSALPYAQLSNRCSEYQKLMRLDWDTSLLPAAQKRSNLACDELHNHHTSWAESRCNAWRVVAAHPSAQYRWPRSHWRHTSTCMRQHAHRKSRADWSSMGTLGNTEGVLDGIVHRCNNQAAPGL